VCGRLALVERLGPKAREELRVGLLSPTAARQIVRLPEGNHAEVLEAVRSEVLSSTELSGGVNRRQRSGHGKRSALGQVSGRLNKILAG
jgi:hypothetical protein